MAMTKTEEEVKHLPVSEIFYSIQGEGVHSGVPSVFLRTYYCNLTCTWCDTKYTWLNQDEASPGVNYDPMTKQETLSRITSYHCKHLVLTGGEPLMHQQALVPILLQLKNLGFFIEVETNGTFAPSIQLLECVDCLNVSPKISNSLVPEKVRFRPDSLRAFVASNKAWFKFVVQNQGDLAEIEEVIAVVSIPRERVLLMPEGIDASELSSRAKWIVEVCERRGYRFCPRLHILLFGNKRGT